MELRLLDVTTRRLGLGSAATFRNTSQVGVYTLSRRPTRSRVEVLMLPTEVRCFIASTQSESPRRTRK